MSSVIRCSLVLVVALPSVLVALPVTGDEPTPVSATALCRDLPRSLRVDPHLRPVMVDMCRRAPTFRRQLARIAEEPGLVVTIAVWHTRSTDQTRAITRLDRALGRLRSAGVEIRIDEGDLVVELIAHEFEHILEQIDDVDLNRWAGRSGVQRVGRSDRTGTIETARARYVGRKVAAEYTLTTPSQAGPGNRP